MCCPRFLIIGFVLIGAPLLAAADSSLAAARAARRLLGPAGWSQVIEIENENARGRYPRVVHALVFELADLLWFYTATDGTQSLSLYRGRAKADQADLGPLLAAIDSGFRRWKVLPPIDAGAAWRGPLPNGCFIESVAAWRRLCDVGSSFAAAMLLSYYGTDANGRHGHTVLAYVENGTIAVIDPEPPVRRFRLPLAVARDPLALARRIDEASIDRARYLALPVPPLLPDARNAWVSTAAPAMPGA